MKVGIAARVLENQVGGNTRYAREIHARLPGFEVEVAVVGRPSPLTRRLPPGARYAASEIAMPFSAKDCDVVFYPADTGPLVKSKVPVVTTIHGVASLHIQGVREARREWLWRQRVTRAALLSDVVVTVSRSAKQDVCDLTGVNPDKVRVIHHGIDHEKFSPTASADDHMLLRRLGLRDQNFFLYVGNFDPRKNISAVIDAASRVWRETGIPTVFSGAHAWGQGDVLKNAEHSQGCRYLGRTSDEVLTALLRNCVAFLFPSKYEGFGFPVLEAMACGAPVICSDRGSLGEVAGDAALILSDLSGVNLAGEMLRLLNSQALSSLLRQKGLLQASKFHWEASLRLHVEAFSSALGMH